ncbi:MAG: ATP-binding cassette domain-containing protein, partial [Saprospiraceae bacterium]|nr:ATP-binding cassette domain-containing protein [Saprospiraceae bacterium]
MQEQQFTEQRALLPFLRRMFTYSLRFKKWLYLFTFFTVVTAIAEALMPLAVVELIDKVLTPQLNQYRQNPSYVFDFEPIMFYGLMYFGLAIAAVLGIYQFIKYAGLLQENIIAALRQDMFEKLQKLHFSFYDRTASGWLLTRINSDTDRVAEVVSWGLVELIWGLCNVLFCILAMLIYNWQLALIVVFTVPTMILASVKVRKLVLKYSRETRRLNSEISAAYTEHINGVSVVKSTAQEERVSQKFNALSDKMRHAQYRASLYTALYLPLVIFVGAIATAFVLFWGGKMTLALPFGISMGVYFAAFEYSKRIFEPISDITRFYATAQSSLAAGERIFSLLNEPILVKNTEGVVNSDFSDHQIEGNIEFQNVSFFYTKEKYVLKNFNLKIKAGESVALVGATGEGKSTIASLVARFYEPTEGCVLIDNINYKALPINTLRSQLGVVLQTPHVFFRYDK